LVLGLGSKDKKKKEEEARQYKEEMALRQESGHQMPAQQDAYASLGRSVYMIMHPEVDEIIMKDPKLKASYPAYSYLNRVTKTGKLQAQIQELDYEELGLITKMNMTEDKYESEGWLKLKALNIFAQSIISDAFGGFKADIVTTQLKTIRTELAEVKKKRLPL